MFIELLSKLTTILIDRIGATVTEGQTDPNYRKALQIGCFSLQEKLKYIAILKAHIK